MHAITLFPQEPYGLSVVAALSIFNLLSFQSLIFNFQFSIFNLLNFQSSIFNLQSPKLYPPHVVVGRGRAHNVAPRPALGGH